jgi:hypothetical protein
VRTRKNIEILDILCRQTSKNLTFLRDDSVCFSINSAPGHLMKLKCNCKSSKKRIANLEIPRSKKVS